MGGGVRVGPLLRLLLLASVMLVAPVQDGRLQDTSERAPVYTYRILHTYPHDPQAFTQGLVFDQGHLYEGTGLYGRSTLRRVELHSGRVMQSQALAKTFFGEGITIWGERLFQLTWRSRVGFVYDKQTLTLQRQFVYATEGWGLTHDHTHLILSDGTSTLYFLDPTTFIETGRVQVHDHRGPVSRLNELEYVQGEIYANVWQTDRIARIDPRSGRITGWIDLTGLLSPTDRRRRVDVLNGIAYDAEQGRLFVTGKWWPKLFEIEIVGSK